MLCDQHCNIHVNFNILKKATLVYLVVKHIVYGGLVCCPVTNCKIEKVVIFYICTSAILLTSKIMRSEMRFLKMWWELVLTFFFVSFSHNRKKQKLFARKEHCFTLRVNNVRATSFLEVLWNSVYPKYFFQILLFSCYKQP